MLALGVLGAFNLLVLLSPPAAMVDILSLMVLPMDGRAFLLFVVTLNVAVSMLYEQYGAGAVAGVVGTVMNWRHGRRRVRDGKVYKAVEED